MSVTNHPKQPGELGPGWAVATGIILLSVAISVSVFTIHCLKSGEMWEFSRHHAGIVSQKDRPGSFWLSVIFTTSVILMLAYFGVSLLREGFKDLRK